MEAYFYNDPRIEEWVDQITEKVFTVCLLNGLDSEVEFQRGCQIVTKVTSLLQGISMFPSEYLEDGLKQLLEQQLPEARVISNFPSFQDTMDKMIREGMSKAIDSQNREALNTLISTNENTGEDHLEDHDQNTERPEEAPQNEGFMTEREIPALASVDITYPEIRENEIELPIKANAIKVGSEIEPSINSNAYGMLRTSQVPAYADSLKRVLSNIFPSSTVYWNINIMGQTFLAQVENILICLLNLEQPCPIEDFTKEGWKVFVCSSEDLTFPRRLERGIRQIQRSGKKSQIV